MSKHDDHTSSPLSPVLSLPRLPSLTSLSPPFPSISLTLSLARSLARPQTSHRIDGVLKGKSEMQAVSWLTSGSMSYGHASSPTSIPRGEPKDAWPGTVISDLRLITDT